MKIYAEEVVLLSQPRRKLISSFSLTNRTLITPLLVFYGYLGLVWTKVYRSIEYIPKKCFNNFVQSVVNTWRQGNEGSDSSVVAETKRMLSNSSYGYQIMDRSWHILTKYLSVEKTHAHSNKKMFKHLGFKNEQLNEVELAKSEIEHKEPIILYFCSRVCKVQSVGAVLQLFLKVCDDTKYEKI